MPISQKSLDAIGALEDGKEILDEIEGTITESLTKVKVENEKLSSENKQRRKALAELQDRIKEAEFDPDKPIKEQVDALQSKIKESASKGKVDNEQVEALNRQLKKMADDFKAEKDLRVAAETKTKIKTAQSAFTTAMKDAFGDPGELLLEKAIREGIITVNDKDEPGVKSGDDFIPQSEDGGATAMNELKRMFPRYVVTKTKGGSGDTKANGGSSTTKGKGDVTRTEWDAMEPFAQSEYYAKNPGMKIIQD